jgi:hypothetical protein
MPVVIHQNKDSYLERLILVTSLPVGRQGRKVLSAVAEEVYLRVLGLTEIYLEKTELGFQLREIDFSLRSK